MRHLLFYIFLLFGFVINGQSNLIENPGFEEYTECPSMFPGNQDIHLAVPWNGFSADFTHSCSGLDPFSVETKQYSSPRTGEGYSRIFSYRIANYDSREFIDVPLFSPMEIGEYYCVEYYCKLYPEAGTGVNGMGAYFTETSPIDYSEIIDFSVEEPNNSFLISPQILNPQVIYTDTLNYMLVSGSFQADKEYVHMVIGNFISDAFLQTEFVVAPTDPGFAGGAIYAIDDVKVYKCDVSVEEEAILNKVFVSGDKLYLKHINTSVRLHIYDLYGRLVSEDVYHGENTHDLSSLPKGIYIYRLFGENELLASGKLSH